MRTLARVKTLGDIGEFELIDRVRARAPTSAPSHVKVGIGDDAAVLRTRPDEDLVVSTDALVEDTHFRWQSQSSSAIGRRALIVNLSDLAAMGARPLACTLAFSAPAELPVAHFDQFMRGFLAEAQRHDCPLVGGNLTRSRETLASVSVMGAVKRGRALLRSGLAAGDRLFVTGSLGGAALARARAERNGTPIRHLPEPRLAAGRALARMQGVGACIDVSDGLISDLGHMLDASQLGAQLDVSRVPRPAGFNAACERLGLAPDPLCLLGGEDYELLFSLRAARNRRATPATLARRLGVEVCEIGVVTRALGLRGAPHLADATGWRHF